MKTHTGKFNIWKLTRLLTIMGIVALSLYACDPSREDNDLQQEHANTYLTEDELEGYAAWAKEQEGYIKVHQNLIHTVENKVELLEEKMANMSLQQQARVREDIRHLERQKAFLLDKIHALEEADEQNWAELKQEVEQIADSLNITIQKIDKNVAFGSVWLIPAL